MSEALFLAFEKLGALSDHTRLGEGAAFLVRVVDDEREPTKLRIQAATVLIKADQGYDEAKRGEREPHEMSIDEIQSKLAALEAEAGNRAKEVGPNASVFE